MGLAQDLQGTGAEPPRAVIRFQFWSLAFDPESPPVSMQPQETTIWRTADGGAQLETRALAAQDSDGNPLDGGTAWAAGEVVFQHTFAPGEPIGLFRQPTSDSDWGELLREGDSLETDAGAPAYFRAVSGLLSEHPLSLEKQSDLVKFLATLPEIRVDGKVTDRLGREGVSFSADDGDSRHTLIVSGSLGILAYELLYTGSERTDLRAPAVIDYRAWY